MSKAFIRNDDTEDDEPESPAQLPVGVKITSRPTDTAG